MWRLIESSSVPLLSFEVSFGNGRCFNRRNSQNLTSRATQKAFVMGSKYLCMKDAVSPKYIYFLEDRVGFHHDLEQIWKCILRRNRCVRPPFSRTFRTHSTMPEVTESSLEIIAVILKVGFNQEGRLPIGRIQSEKARSAR